MKKIICFAAAMLIACTAAGCGEKKKGGNLDVPDDYNAAQDEMPYGSTMTEIRPTSDENVKVMVCFDKRFFGENDDLSEIYKLTDCIAGLNSNDHELLESCYYPGYLEKSAEGSGAADVSAYLDDYHESIESVLGKNFEIDYIEISQCYQSGDSTADSFFEIADEILTDIAGEDVLKKVTSRKLVEIGGYTTFKSDENSGLLADHTADEGAMKMCLYKIGGEYYLF